MLTASIILAVLALLCALLGIPTPGGVNANVIMLVPAAGFAVLAGIMLLLHFIL